MSVQELQARISEVSADIDRQKEVLTKLEKSKTALQRQLNAVRDPVARLPLEISSEIFVQCLPPITPRPGARHVPMLLLNICSAWTEIALSTSALWASIYIIFPRAEGFSDVIRTWLKRARNLPLSISLHKSFDISVATVVGLYAEQLKNLKIYRDTQPLILPRVKSFPSLETLTMAVLQLDERGVPPTFGTHQLLELLRRAPNLLECNFDNFHIHRDQSISPLVLPSLSRLVFGRFEEPFSLGGGDGILKSLTLPALKTLGLLMSSITPGDLIAFLTRSSPPLEELYLVLRTDPFSALDRSFRLVPTLTDLMLYRPGSAFVYAFFVALAEDAQGFLPTLHHLSIQCCPRLSAFSYEALFRALSLRRAQIASVELICALTDASRPSGIAFRQLAADGMKIHIGTKDQNFLSV
ncbi:hypothetical protein FB451DRAFT_1559305 [Mycena latifolia]|nr:hypothetical protein FB451DRAFT_1559305 [Mycena latifolia]